MSEKSHPNTEESAHASVVDPAATAPTGSCTERLLSWAQAVVAPLLWWRRPQHREVSQRQHAPHEERPCVACDNNKDPIGAADRDVHVMSFSGGGYDAVMQLGVIHALVVADAQPPDLVVGISVGAVNAAALAEVMQADRSIPDNLATQRREARMSRFREFLYEVQEMPPRLRDMLLPDMYEADAGMALESHRLVTHHDRERRERQDAMQARSGLVAFLNAVARQRITIATLTRYARCFLGLRAARAQTRSEGWRAFLGGWSERLREATRALRTFAMHAPSSVGAVLFIVRASVKGRQKRRGYPAGHIIFRARTPALVALFLALGATATTLLAMLPATSVLTEIGREFLPYTGVLFAAQATVVSVMLAAITYVGLVGFYTVVAAVLFSLLLIPNRRLRYAVLNVVRDRFLAHYGLLHDLGGYYFIRDAFIRLFDPSYFGRARTVAARNRAAMSDATTADDTSLFARAADDDAEVRRTFAVYTAAGSKIHVVPVAADLSDGKLTPLGPETPIVDGLLAATAQPPIVRPIHIRGTYFINGTKIASEPTMAIRQLLRDRVHPEATSVQLFTVSSLPVEKQELPELRRKRYHGLMDVLLRVQQLRRFRTARLDRRITALYDGALPATRVPPERKPDGKRRALKCFGYSEHMVRTTVVPIEPPEYAINLSTDLLRARTRNEQVEAIARTVATGCRLTLETIIAKEVGAVANGSARAKCAAVIAYRRGEDVGAAPVGASEICSRCMLGEAEAGAEPMELQTRPNSALRWPIDMRLARNAPLVTEPDHVEPASTNDTGNDVVRPPTVSLLFSGGVFRGVFLVGVLNALELLRIQPQIVAGSSVGSITAAMAARLFTMEEGERRRGMNELAATYLALDEHLVTDRFADFVRRLALRASEANVSFADIDDALRSYDRPTGGRWARAMRQLASGVEHLLYVSPFELLSFVHSVRRRDARRTYRLLRRYFQALLDRGGVGLEVLGTEPLSFLIREHVLPPSLREQRAVPLDAIGRGNPTLLLTATNLASGELETIGRDPLKTAVLVEALLASSAFPGVFRPRWGWEVFVRTNVNDQLVDGGIMDNLPLDTVVGYLQDLVTRRAAAIRPGTESSIPHLIFTASLERDAPTVSSKALARIAQRWPATRERALQLRYNRKIDTFATAQREFRTIYDRYKEAVVELPRNPLDIEAVVVKPQWLCGTFAFHPMLGFSRDRQAASIAHGCAATLQQVASLEVEKGRWLDAWGFHQAVRTSLRRDRLETLTPANHSNGTCHFRDAECPFSRGASDTRVGPAMQTDLHRIYVKCGQVATHRANR